MLQSPLRYPGGKAKLFPFLSDVIKSNDLFRYQYSEPYAGGAGLAIKLLVSGFVDRISLNDIDPAIYSFWFSALRHSDQFCRLIESTPITVEEWFRQREHWTGANTRDPITLGFAAFYLNRTSRSGIIEGAGPIGGYSQHGKWKIDVRLDKEKHINNIRALSQYAGQIELSNDDALFYLRRRMPEKERFFYLDPPYYVKGYKLYKSYYEHADHVNICNLLTRNRSKKWITSYDDVLPIRQIYSAYTPMSYCLQYSAGRKSYGNEVVFFSDGVSKPDTQSLLLVA